MLRRVGQGKGVSDISPSKGGGPNSQVKKGIHFPKKRRDPPWRRAVIALCMKKRERAFYLCIKKKTPQPKVEKPPRWRGKKKGSSYRLRERGPGVAIRSLVSKIYGEMGVWKKGRVGRFLLGNKKGGEAPTGKKEVIAEIVLREEDC